MASRTEQYIETVYRSKLNQDQQKFLDSFIRNFLPSNEQRRKNNNNKLVKIHETLDKIFLQNMEYGISERDVIDAFLRMNYKFRAEVTFLSEISIPSSDGFYEHAYEEMDALRKERSRKIDSYIIHISVSAKSVNDLWMATKRIPVESANEEKTIKPRIVLKKQIRSFFGLSQNLPPSDFIPKYILASK